MKLFVYMSFHRVQVNLEDEFPGMKLLAQSLVVFLIKKIFFNCWKFEIQKIFQKRIHEKLIWVEGACALLILWEIK